jgi:BirA family biotin operon repressor/biotin-[acetyl-CoA-carboxylase] ligase
VASDGLSEAVEGLPPGWVARYVETVASTQDEARAAARLGAPSRSIVGADFPRAGRGRQGRAWLAQPGDALLLSVVFRQTGPASPMRWTNLASVALVEAIDELLPGVQTAIKWPNDVLLGDRKVAGILAETAWDGRELVAIVGVGVNVNTSLPDLQQVHSAATSLRAAAGQGVVDRARVLHAFVRRMDVWLGQPFAAVHAAWQRRLWGRGQRLRLVDLGLDEMVVVLGVDPDGSLRVRLPDGTQRRTTTGELIL